MEKYPCTCGGENSSCYRCDGTGMVSSQTLPLRSDGRVHPQPQSTELHSPSPLKTAAPKTCSPVEEKRFHCARCNIFIVDPTEFIYHARSEHPKAKLKTSNSHQSKKQSKRVTPAQEQSPNQNKLTLEELQENQCLLNEARKALKQIRRTYTGAQLCYHCFEIFKTQTELIAHHEDKHASMHTEPLVITKRKNKKALIGKKQKTNQRGIEKTTTQNEIKSERHRFNSSLNTHEQYTLAQRMDATYGMGGFARDHGQFGSAPAYDGMDDESSP